VTTWETGGKCFRNARAVRPRWRGSAMRRAAGNPATRQPGCMDIRRGEKPGSMCHATHQHHDILTARKTLEAHTVALAESKNMVRRTISSMLQHHRPLVRDGVTRDRSLVTGSLTRRTGSAVDDQRVRCAGSQKERLHCSRALSADVTEALPKCSTEVDNALVALLTLVDFVRSKPTPTHSGRFQRWKLKPMPSPVLFGPDSPRFTRGRHSRRQGGGDPRGTRVEIRLTPTPVVRAPPVHHWRRAPVMAVGFGFG